MAQYVNSLPYEMQEILRKAPRNGPFTADSVNASEQQHKELIGLGICTNGSSCFSGARLGLWMTSAGNIIQDLIELVDDSNLGEHQPEKQSA